jgi:ribose transport system permease protein
VAGNAKVSRLPQGKENTMGKKLLNWCKACVLPLAVFAIFALITGGRFSRLTSILSVLRTAVVPLLISMALSFGMIMNMWNFAVGAITYACAIFGAVLSAEFGLGIPGLCLFSVIIGVLLCTLMGLMYRRFRIPCLVLSLGVAMMTEALPGILIKDGTGKIDLLDGYLGSAPWCYAIALVMFAVFAYINGCTTLGANMRAIGTDIKIADSAGIKIDRIKFISFILTGVFLGVAGIVFMSVNVSVIGVVGFASAGMLFDGIMSVFVAMVLIRYVDFSVAILIGTITIRMLSAGLVAFGFSSEARGILTGVFLFLVVSYSTNSAVLERNRARKRIAKRANAEFANAELAKTRP